MVMEWSYVGAVVVSGLVIVFVALILLILAVWLMGKIFTAIKNGNDKKAETQKASGNAAPAVKPAPVSAPAPMSSPAAQTAVSEEDEVIAVIAAAVAAMAEESGKPLKIKSVRPAKGKARSNAWAGAAAAESTRAF